MTISYLDLWLAIVVSTVLCWVASAIIHMVIKYHDKDYRSLANEDEVRAAIRNGNPAPAFYTIPYCADMKEMGSDEMQAKMKEGPMGYLTIVPNGNPNMGKLMGQQLLHFFIVSALVAYLAAMALPAGSDYMHVFRFVMTAGFVGYGLANIPYSIWYGQPWGTTFRFLLDALIYGAVTAGVFGWQWP